MKKPLLTSSSILNIILIITILFGIYMYMSNTTISTAPIKKVTKTEQTTQPQSLPIEAILISGTSILLFFLKYLLIDKKIISNKNKIDNTKHVLFLNLMNINYAELPSVRLASEGRSLMYRDMIKIEVTVIEKFTREFIENNKTFTSPADFKQKLNKLLIDITEETDKVWRLEGIPKLVIDTYKDIEHDRLQILKAALDDITLYSEENWDAAIREFLNSLGTHIQLFITEDTIEVFNKLNGKLTGLKYKEEYL